jgi:hypothetical protein
VNFLIWLEQTPLSVWVREAPTLWAFPFILFLHTLGLAILAGLSVAFNLWILLGYARRYSLAPLRPFFPLMWIGFTVNLVSGLLLLAAYPAKALTNPVFYIKMLLIVLAVGELEWARKVVFAADRATQWRPTPMLNALAVAALVLWAGAVLTGRLLAYTHSVLMASEGF